MFNVLVAEDEKETRDYIKNLLTQIYNVKLVGEVTNGKELVNAVNKLEPEVLLVDIEMPGMNGLAAVEAILKQDYDPYIIFLTGYDDFALDAFDLSAVDYIVKPVRLPRLQKAFEKISKLKAESMLQLEEIKNALTAAAKICIKSEQSFIFLDIDSVIMAERKKKETIIYCKDTRYETIEPLNNLEEKLKFPQFFRTHKSFIVNIKHVHKIIPLGNRTYEIKFHDLSNSALISRAKAKELFSLLNIS